MVTAEKTTGIAVVKYYKSDIKRILPLIHDRYKENRTIDWRRECVPINSSQHQLLFFRFMLSYDYIERMNSSRGEIYKWKAPCTPQQLYVAVAELLPDYEDERGRGRDLFECVGDERPVEAKEYSAAFTNEERILRYADSMKTGFTLNGAVTDLEGEVHHKSVSPLLSLLIQKNKLIRIGVGAYILPKYKTTSQQAVIKTSAPIMYGVNTEIVDMLKRAPSFVRFSTIREAFPKMHFTTINNKLKQLLSEGLIERPHHGCYAVVRDKSTTVSNDVKPAESVDVLKYYGDYKAMRNASKEKLDSLLEEKLQCVTRLSDIEKEMKKVMEANTALDNLVKAMESLNAIGLNSMIN